MATTLSLPARSLPARSLPARFLPSHILKLIREFSCSLTRPDWKKHTPIISTFNLYVIVKSGCRDIIHPPRLYYIILNNIYDTYWYHNDYLEMCLKNSPTF